MKKGFTLVELLAVIAIVAVLGIITVPMIMTTVEDSKKAAFTTGAQSVLDTAKTYVTRIEESGDFPKTGIKVSELKSELKNYDYVSGFIVKQEDGSIIVDGLSNGEYCARGTKNDLKVIKGDCTELDDTPPLVQVFLNRRTSSSITILVRGIDSTSDIYGYSYSTDGINYTEIKNQNIYTVDGLHKNQTVKIYVRVYNNNYDHSNSEENLKISMTEQVVEYTTLEVEKPRFVVSTSESSATTVKIVDIIYPENVGNYVYTYEIDGKEQIVDGKQTRITITENVVIKARIKTETETIENILRIAGIDNVGPEANIIYKTSWEKNKKIKIEVTKEQTGLPSEPYSYDGGTTWTSDSERVYVTSETLTGKIQVRDVLGNITVITKVNGKEDAELIIDYIDNEAPRCSLKITSGTLGNNNWYISNVNVDFSLLEDVSKYCENGKCVEKTPGSGIKSSDINIRTVTQNGRINVIGTVEDNVGNKGTCSLMISKDSATPIAPVITVSDNIGSGSWHKSNFSLSFSGNDNVSGVYYEYSTNGYTYTTGNNINMTTNTTGTTYYVRACSNAGICGPTSSYQVKLDKDIPIRPTISPNDNIGSGSWHKNNFTLNFSGNNNISGVNYEYSTDGSNYTGGSSVTISSNTTGTTYYVRACSNAGICGEASSYQAKLDKDTPIRPTISPSDNIGSGSWHKSNFTLHFSGNNNISGVNYEYSTNGFNYIRGSSVAISSNTTGTTYYVRACSNAGICGEASSYQAKLDKDTPIRPTISPNDNIGSGSWHKNNFALNFSGNNNISGVNYEYSTNGFNYIRGSSVAISSNTTGTTYYVRACSNAGICGSASSYQVKLDKEMPSKPTISASDKVDSGSWHGNDFTLRFSGNKNISGVNYEYSTDGSNYTGGSSVTISSNTTGTTYYVRACSNAGICGEASSYEAKLDKDTPSNPTISASDNVGSDNWHSEGYKLTISGDGTISGTTHQYSTDGSNYTNGDSISITSETTGTKYYARTCNAVRCSSATSYTAKLDIKGPTLEVTSAGKYYNDITLKIKAEDKISGMQAITYELYLNDEFYDAVPYGKKTEYSISLTAGKWDLYINALDNADNWYYSEKYEHFQYYVNVCGKTTVSASNGKWGSCSVDCGGGTKYYYEDRNYYSNITGELCKSEANVNTGQSQSCNTGSCGDGSDCCSDCSCTGGKYCGAYCTGEIYYKTGDPKPYCTGSWIDHC